MYFYFKESLRGVKTYPLSYLLVCVRCLNPFSGHLGVPFGSLLLVTVANFLVWEPLWVASVCHRCFGSSLLVTVAPLPSLVLIPFGSPFLVTVTQPPSLGTCGLFFGSPVLVTVVLPPSLGAYAFPFGSPLLVTVAPPPSLGTYEFPIA